MLKMLLVDQNYKTLYYAAAKHFLKYFDFIKTEVTKNLINTEFIIFLTSFNYLTFISITRKYL